jgi:MFS family permease
VARRGTGLQLYALVFANTVSLVGNVLASVAVPWFVLETTGSAAKTGVAAFFSTVPLGLGALFGGAIADRVGRRTVSAVTDVCSAAAIAAIPLLHAAGSLEFWELATFVFLAALFDAPGQAAREALLPELAERSGRSLARATSLWASTEHIGYVVGAPIAGALIALLGAANVLWLDAASFVASAVAVVVGVRSVHARRAPSRYLDELRAGLRVLLGDNVLRFFLLAASTGNMLAAPIALVFLPVWAKDVVGSAPVLGVAVAAYGIGGIGSAVLLEPAVRFLGRRRAYLASWVLWVLVYFGIALLPPPPVMILILLASGLSVAAQVEALVRQERTPPEVRARVFGMQMAALTIAAPIGVIVGGYLVEALGLRTAMLTLATVNAVGALGFVRRAAAAVASVETASAAPQPRAAPSTLQRRA